jgi:hypothetical protein
MELVDVAGFRGSIFRRKHHGAGARCLPGRTGDTGKPIVLREGQGEPFPELARNAAARAVEAARDDRAEDRNQRVNGAIAAS